MGDFMEQDGKGGEEPDLQNKWAQHDCGRARGLSEAGLTEGERLRVYFGGLPFAPLLNNSAHI